MPDRKITVTDEMAERVQARMRERGMGFLSRYSILELLSAALDAAPTTDECPIDYKVLFEREEARAEKAERERDEWKTRAEAAEPSRDVWRRYAKERAEALREQQAVIESLRAMSARDHLAAVWEAAYVPEDGIIPKGSSIITRSDHGDGDVRLQTLEATGRDLPDPGEVLDDPRYGPRCGQETRLLDPPTPKRPDGAEVLARVEEYVREVGDGAVDALDDFLTSRGVRVVSEDGAR